MKKLTALAFLVALLAASGSFGQDVEMAVEGRRANGPNPFNAVVRIEATKAEPDLANPWRIADRGDSAGSGFVIKGRRILSNAHCVLDATLVTVHKQSVDAPFTAHVEYLNFDSDLALLEVDDETFFDDIEPLELGETPTVRDHVVAVGYPIGGSRIAFTEGVVSRTEMSFYSISRQYLPSAQVDAAVNPGNSGGPVLDVDSGLVVGIAFQMSKEGENIGYIIPVDVVRHFLHDIEDGQTDGFGDLYFHTRQMVNPAARRALGMKPGMTGCYVHDVEAPWPGTDALRNGDILLAVDGVTVSDTCNVRLPDGRTLNYRALVVAHQLGEDVEFTVLRDGAPLVITNTVSRTLRRIRPPLAGDRPDYYIFGGLVFSTLTMDLWQQLNSGMDFSDGAFAIRQDNEDELVILTDVLSDPVNLGYTDATVVLVEAVDGQPVHSLKGLARILDSATNDFVCIEIVSPSFRGDKHIPLILDTAKAREALPAILERYQVPADRSPDIR
ncbi:MAG: trypsin-like peptidase domain-containing protein [Kiritimatiellae bacterium]|nr:trypsin-like peptidase domain-containing protein [Kiritimatiellia bacterium]